MNPYEQIYDVDLSKGITQKDIGTLVFEGDNNSIKVGSNVYNSGVPQQLSGSIEGKVIRQDGGTVYYVGTISDNTGYITLTEAAFAYPGPIEIFVRIVSGQDKITIGAFKAKAKRTDTGKAIDPGQPVPGIAELAEDVAELKTGKKNTQSAIPSPTASGNALAFIDTLSQDAQGVISATKKSVTIDATPTANSTNPVQSGGVKAALDGKQDTLTLPLPVSQGGTGATTAESARANLGCRAITANMGTITGTGSTVTVTKTVTGVTANMTVDRIEFGTPSAVQSGWTVTTAANSVTFSATISGSTTVKIKLSDNTDVTGT